MPQRHRPRGAAGDLQQFQLARVHGVLPVFLLQQVPHRAEVHARGGHGVLLRGVQEEDVLEESPAPRATPVLQGLLPPASRVWKNKQKRKRRRDPEGFVQYLSLLFLLIHCSTSAFKTCSKHLLSKTAKSCISRHRSRCRILALGAWASFSPATPALVPNGPHEPPRSQCADQGGGHV